VLAEKPTLHAPALQRNPVYTGITRGKRLVAVAARNNKTEQRFSGY
jgi:hypothetical protein